MHRAGVEGRQYTHKSFLHGDQPDRYGNTHTHSNLYAYHGRIAHADSYLFGACRNGNANTDLLHAHWNNHSYVFYPDRDSYPHDRDSWNCYPYLLHTYGNGDGNTHVFNPDRDGDSYAHFLHTHRNSDAHTNFYACRVRNAYRAGNCRQTSNREFI
jgi:hypothetical protein